MLIVFVASNEASNHNGYLDYVFFVLGQAQKARPNYGDLRTRVTTVSQMTPHYIAIENINKQMDLMYTIKNLRLIRLEPFLFFYFIFYNHGYSNTLINFTNPKINDNINPLMIMKGSELAILEE